MPHDYPTNTTQAKARKIHGTIRFNETFDEEKYLSTELRNAIEDIKATRSEKQLHGLFQEIFPGVYSSESLFRTSLLEDLVKELNYQKSSGIPERRPNGMNRYGTILSDEETSLLAPSIAKFVDNIVRPIASSLFPAYASSNSMAMHYAFTVRYAEDEDRELALHRDASVVTMNLCLGTKFRGGLLSFSDWEEPVKTDHHSLFSSNGDVDENLKSSKTIQMTPGMSLWHRGQHQHQAHPIESGERINLIVWLFAPNGDVRVAPFPPHERMDLSGRWGEL